MLPLLPPLGLSMPEAVDMLIPCELALLVVPAELVITPCNWLRVLRPLSSEVS